MVVTGVITERQSFRETCSIEPEEMRSIMPSGAHLDYDTQTLSSRTTMTEESSQTVGRMVDWCLALNLDDEDEDLVDEAFASMKGGEQSLNQSLSYIHKCPLFLHIEIKKTQSNRDPEVQLAIWASGALLKHQHHGWDTSMPMPAIAINGNSWDYFIFFEAKGDLVCVCVCDRSRVLSSHVTGNDGSFHHGFHQRTQRHLSDILSPSHTLTMGCA